MNICEIFRSLNLILTLSEYISFSLYVAWNLTNELKYRHIQSDVRVYHFLCSTFVASVLFQNLRSCLAVQISYRICSYFSNAIFSRGSRNHLLAALSVYVSRCATRKSLQLHVQGDDSAKRCERTHGFPGFIHFHLRSLEVASAFQTKDPPDRTVLDRLYVRVTH